MRTLFALLLLAAVPASAAPKDRVDEATIAAAERFVDTMGLEANFRSMSDQLIDVVSGGMAEEIEAQTGEEFPPALLAEIRTIMSGQMRKAYRENAAALRRATALVHARHFSSAELERLTALMNDPTMRKYTDMGPQIGPELSGAWDLVVGHRDDEETEKLVTDAVERHFQQAGKLPKPIS